jgi:REP element-mobilizing transposase RayT
MSDKFRNIYRIPTTRLPNWDYSDSGYYFITICTKDKEDFFGEIIKNEIHLTKIGKIAQKYWIEISKHFLFVELDEFIIMPSHVHGILIIKNTGDDDCRDVINHVSTDHVNKNVYSKITPMNKHSLGEIIRWYKGRMTFEINKIKINFSWQSRYYDHIIRNEKEFCRIKQYVKDNPMNWETDENNSGDWI